MMNMIRSTSMTSISGVVLISIMGSSSPPPPTLIAISNYPYPCNLVLTAGRSGLGDEPDLLDAGALRRQDDAAHELVARHLVGAHVHFRLRLLHGGRLQPLEQLVGI